MKRSTRTSTLASLRRGTSVGATAVRTRSRPNASADPAAPPHMARSALSVRACRARRPRPAPRAIRIARSRSRAEARASIRLATFAHAIRTTASTAANSTQEVSLAS